MTTVFVLINTKIGQESCVFEALETVPEVKEVYHVYGVYDIIAQIECDSMAEIKDSLRYRIRRVPGIRSTLTMIVT